MTIALGILARDGVVLAADTQETYPGALKVDQGKILAATDWPEGRFLGACAVTGAGTATHLDSIQQQLCGTYLAQKPSTLDALQQMLAAQLLAFNKQHIVPFAAWPEYDRPECSLVIAAAREGQFNLWTTEKSAMRSVPFGTVGIGAAHAHYLLHRLWRADERLITIVMLAAYVMYFVKQSVEGCGKDTHIVAIQADGYAYSVEIPRIEAMESDFQRYADAEDWSVRYVLGMGPRRPKGGATKAMSNLHDFRYALKAHFAKGPIELTDSQVKRGRIGTWMPGHYPIPTPRQPPQKARSTRRRVRKRTHGQ
jgi:hypothetical protein